METHMKIDVNKNVNFLENKEYREGPLSGICEHNGSKYWVESYLDYHVEFTDSKGENKADLLRAFCAVKLNKFLTSYILFGKNIFRKLVYDLADNKRSHIAFKIWYKFLQPRFFNLKPKGRPAFSFYWTEVDKKSGTLLGRILTPRGAFNIK